MNDADAMRHALSLGRRGLGRVWPNPAVGCVIVSGSRIVGRGWTRPGGRPHAERVALDQAGPLARGATAYVSLEPCAHHGRTPPCAEGLIEAGVARVVTTMEDPDPRVAGRGLAMLRAAGVTVETGICVDRARADQAGFLSRINLGRPMVTLKLATSFDGRIATASGESRWITGPAARRVVHAARLDHDAVLVGGGTARADDPELTVRELGARHQPIRIVAARRLDLPASGRLAASAGPDLWLLHADAPDGRRGFWEGAGARLIQVPLDGGRLDPAAMLAELGAQGLTRIFCEGGGSFAAALLQAGLVDRLVSFNAGLALGAEGQPALGAMGVSALADAPRFRLLDTRAIGPDVMTTWERA
ncbi:bifunctional diaminohydroxyphosphoribosylaminopyrimidine deaminase/5-amino-6-(5-phosphoribosylamino)uracil reductase RibD [Palleronia sp. LCG004]|uniref:bifunctional diaminohydroxyphosphoribosylaminopyrimidine deaminase/5-amino-6-(5-phosphoribosylamino)uracil reductase RibD n=1 Tax=Palleronia sp. LCG004 TaxID=3079304 RepID=UPI0029434702|nr:bifunctional diaminohydroxyphosphoribosylaminopyrimidine deaminase/5-amino-6-(5-phosphoribosylamino)uracil reductase RibD [Palleronia sp. LCG004]WOI57063.1 bifunctional diaminohydroxyphosphoribosylaminopyrimidine deaminase/5-amino-6-(5-phosphoribosylamino)uracil reductase RibD [Palleronia sp. LCG004]